MWHTDEFEPVVTIHLPRDPVSQGADGRKRRALGAELRQLTSQVPWMYTGDVSVEIEWTVHLQWRYESDRAEDVDNIVKPILDGITGPEGVLIDDTQVNHVSVNWNTWLRTDRQHLKIRFRSLDQDLYASKQDLVFVEVRPKLFLPLPALRSDPEGRNLMWRAATIGFDGYDDLMAPVPAGSSRDGCSRFNASSTETSSARSPSSPGTSTSGRSSRSSPTGFVTSPHRFCAVTPGRRIRPTPILREQNGL